MYSVTVTYGLDGWTVYLYGRTRRQVTQHALTLFYGCSTLTVEYVGKERWQ